MKIDWLAAVLILTAGAAFPQAPSSVEGTVASVLMDRVQIKTADGKTVVAVLPAGMSVTRRVNVVWSDIHAGDWVGVDSKPGDDGRQESVAINVFAPSMVGKVRKGQFTMASGDLMTNALVDQITPDASGAALVLKNDEAMVPVRITAATTVHRLRDAAASDLRAGLSVSIRGTLNADGSLQASSATITGP
jgi:translation initiation factor IF-1